MKVNDFLLCTVSIPIIINLYYSSVHHFGLTTALNQHYGTRMYN